MNEKIRRMTQEILVDSTLVDLNITTTEIALIRQGLVIRAIKSVRERTGLGLREAKTITDKAIKRLKGEA